MSAKEAEKLAATVTAAEKCRGECGPCDSLYCEHRATWRVSFLVQQVHALAYVCETHAGFLGVDT